MNNIGYIKYQAASGLPPAWKASTDEPYCIRRFDPNNERDVETVYLMDRHPSVQCMPEDLDDDDEEIIYEEMMSEADDFDSTTNEYPSSIFAVTDDESRVIGWVWYYADKHDPLPDQLAGELETDGSQTLFLEISYQKLGADWPEEILNEIETLERDFVKTQRKGVAVSGVRQTLGYIKATTKFRKIVVYAYTETGNLASEKVLEKNGFQCAEETEIEEGKIYHLWYKKI